MNTSAQHIQKVALCPHINVASRVLTSAFGESIPADFEWWVTLGRSEVSAGWAWAGDPDRSKQGEVRAGSSDQLLALWLAVDWRAERRESKATATRA